MPFGIQRLILDSWKNTSTLPGQLPWMIISKVSLDDGSEATESWALYSSNQSDPKLAWDQCSGLHLPFIHHLKSPWISEPKATLLTARLVWLSQIGLSNSWARWLEELLQCTLPSYLYSSLVSEVILNEIIQRSNWNQMKSLRWFFLSWSRILSNTLAFTPPAKLAHMPG